VTAGRAPGLLEGSRHDEGALLGGLRDGAALEGLGAVLAVREADLVAALDTDDAVDAARGEPRLLDLATHRDLRRAEPVGETAPEVAVAVRRARVARAVHVRERGGVGDVGRVEVQTERRLVLDVDLDGAARGLRV